MAIINGQVAGHISIIAPYPYLTDALAGLGQVGLFVIPRIMRRPGPWRS
jgi:hypothetical protein